MKVVAARDEVEIGGAQLDRMPEKPVDLVGRWAVDLCVAVDGCLDRVRPGQGLRLGLVRLDEAQRRSSRRVQHVDGGANRGMLGNHEIQAPGEGESQLVGDDDVRRVGDRDADVLGRGGARDGTESSCRRLGQQACDGRVDLSRIDDDVAKSVLLGEGDRDVLLARRPRPDR